MAKNRWVKTNFLETKLHEYFKKKFTTRVRDKLSASDTGCVLHRQLKMWGVPTDRPLSYQEMVTFDFGNMIHTFLQERLKDAEILEAKEIELEDELTLGHADALVVENGVFVPYEFKSIKDYGLDMIEKEGKPQEAHIRQLVGGYMRLLKKMKVPNIANYGKIVYIAKCFDDGHRKFLYKGKPLGNEKVILRFVEFRGDYDPKIAEAVEKENKAVVTAIKAKVPLKCSEWGKVYHRDTRWNQYLSWCTGQGDENILRLDKYFEDEEKLKELKDDKVREVVDDMKDDLKLTMKEE